MKNNTINFSIEGMSCMNCAAGIKKHLEKNNFSNIQINFTTNEGKCDINKSQSKEEVLNIVSELGFEVSFKKNNTKPSTKLTKTEKYFYFSLLFTLPLFAHMFVPHDNFLRNPEVQFILCLPVYILGVNYFGKSAFKSLKARVANMDVLIFIGSSSAFFYSLYGWISFYDSVRVYDFLFFETAATIITLVLLGNLLEQFSVKKTTTSISDLSQFQEGIAKKIENTKIKKIPFAEIKVNDVIIIGQGDIIPTDGIVISGDCFVDESMISGETIGVSKVEGDEVIGGTIISEGNMKMKVTKIGKETVLSQIIQLVKDAQNDKPEIQKIGDKVSAVFVPLVIGIAILSFMMGVFIFDVSSKEMILRSIAILVISCPCAMGLATPTAVMVGIGRAAKNGILIKGGSTIEKIAKIQHLVFDKTGVLTSGEFEISEINTKEKNIKELKNIIFHLESYSSHPIAKSLCKEYENNSYPINLEEVKEIKGKSIKGKLNNDIYEIGSYRLYNNDPDSDLYFLKNGKLIATLNIKDKTKKNTKKIIKHLKDKELNITMLSGDKKKKCSDIANELSIENFFYEQLPNEKLEKIKNLNYKEKCAMIGDGINDAPALSQAYVGISLGNATKIAIQSSDVVLLNSDNIHQLPKVISIGKHTVKTIKQNLFWAFSYNIIAIPIAMLGMLNPMWAALFMAFSDIVVIGNSIRLRYKKIF